MSIYLDRMDPRASVTAEDRRRQAERPDWLVALLEEGDACERAKARLNLDLTRQLAEIAWGMPR
jgi:hypothetical protein